MDMRIIKCLEVSADGEHAPIKAPIEVKDGIVYDYELGIVLKPGRRTDLLGWGPLDGPAVELAGQCAWTLLVPVREMERVGARIA